MQTAEPLATPRNRFRRRPLPSPSISFVETEAELQNWLAARRDIYLAAGIIATGDLQDGIYCDEYEAQSQHVLARNAWGDTVGCARLIQRSASSPLQVERQFGVTVPSRSVEISGFAVADRQRGTTVSLALIKAMIELACDCGAEWIYCEIEDWFLESLQALGFPLLPVSEPRYVYNSWNVVCRASVQEVLAAISDATSSPAMEYMRLPLHWSETAVGDDVAAACII